MGIFSRLKSSNTLYFPGCLTYFKFKENFELYKKIFSKLGISFKIIDKKICCGLPAYEAGYEAEARKLARRNFEIFKEEGIKEIITPSPCCYKMFSQDYPELLPDWNIEVKNIWEIILDKLENKSRLIKYKAMQHVTYQDSCYLGRYSKIYQAPREILELIGYQIEEMPDSREKSICCGSCGGLPRTNPKLADEVAREKLLQISKRGIRKVIVMSLDNYQLLKKNAGEFEIKVLEFSEVLASALKIKIKREELEEELTKEEQLVLEAKANIQLEEELKEEDYLDEMRG
jgi:Fe-S oxidoreductase